MNIPNWKSDDFYKKLEKGYPESLAWEFLRQNTKYQDEYKNYNNLYHKIWGTNDNQPKGFISLHISIDLINSLEEKKDQICQRWGLRAPVNPELNYFNLNSASRDIFSFIHHLKHLSSTEQFVEKLNSPNDYEDSVFKNDILILAVPKNIPPKYAIREFSIIYRAHSPNTQRKPKHISHVIDALRIFHAQASGAKASEKKKLITYSNNDHDVADAMKRAKSYIAGDYKKLFL